MAQSDVRPAPPGAGPSAAPEGSAESTTSFVLYDIVVDAHGRPIDLRPQGTALAPRGDLLDRMLEAARTGEPIALSERDGGDGRVLDYTIVRPSPGVLGVACVDATERRRAREENARLAAAVECAADEIVITDRRGVIQYVNPAFERTTGYSRSEAVGATTSLLKSGKHSEAFYRDLWETISEGRVWRGRFVNRCKDGREILEDATVASIRDAGGAVVGYVSARRDVTAQAELAERVAEAHRLEAIGRLAGGIAHDFNNVLAGIAGLVELSRKKVVRGLDVRAELGAVLDASERATDLVRRLSAFAGRAQPVEGPVELAGVIDEALELIRAVVPPSITIERDLASEAVVMADPSEIHRVIVNLGTNAGLAMRGRGGTLTVRLTEIEIGEEPKVTSLAPGRYARLEVRDTGCGMPPEVKARIFEPFFTTRAVGEGTGMGLAVVHGIVTSYGGAIEVESEVGRGSTFAVLLPAAARRSDEEEALRRASLPPGHARLLFVHDEATGNELGDVGFAVRAFTTGHDALSTFRSAPDGFDVVVIDTTATCVRGDDLARKLRQIRPDLPIVLCCAHGDRPLPRERDRAAADAVLLKPFTEATLSESIREVLDRRHARQRSSAKRLA